MINYNCVFASKIGSKVVYTVDLNIYPFAAVQTSEAPPSNFFFPPLSLTSDVSVALPRVWDRASGDYLYTR